jgi:tetratricopeptide (TPR) repeat protein
MTTNVFISYSSKDRKQIDDCLTALKTLDPPEAFRVFIDEDIDKGEDWEKRIREALKTADIAVLFVSNNFLASKYVKTVELPRLFARYDAETVDIIPVFLSPSGADRVKILYEDAQGKQQTKLISAVQGVGRPKKGATLMDLPAPKRLHECNTLAEAIQKRLNEHPPQGSTPSEVSPTEKSLPSPNRAAVVRGRRIIGNPEWISLHQFKDRERAIQSLVAFLVAKNVRVISVAGRGGMGKTALVWRVLAEESRVGQDSCALNSDILYVNAGTQTDLIARIYTGVVELLTTSTVERDKAIATKLSTFWADGKCTLQEKVEYLVEQMQDKNRSVGSIIVVLDSLECHLDDHGSITTAELRLLIERCLAQPSRILLVITSRRDVKVTRPHLVGRIALHGGLPDFDAVELLRVLDQAGVGLASADESRLRKVAHWTGGIPRALEIVYGMLFNRTAGGLQQLLKRWPAFQDEAVVGWLVAEGYGSMDRNCRRVMDVLAVFGRPVDRDGVAYVIKPWITGYELDACLTKLASSYFARTSAESGKYWLHDLDREYALAHIERSPIEGNGGYDLHGLDLRAAGFYRSERKPKNDRKTIEDLNPQVYEVAHRLRAGDYDEACRVLNSIDDSYLRLWGYYDDLVHWRKRLQGNLTDPRLRASNSANLGRVYCIQGRIDDSLVLLEKALVEAKEFGKSGLNEAKAEECRYLDYLATAYLDKARFEEAIKRYQQAIDLAQQTRQYRTQSICLGRMAVAYRSIGRVTEGIELQEKALQLAREHGYRDREGVELGGLGTSYREFGEFGRALDYYNLALTVAREPEVGERRREGIWLGFISIIYRFLGELDKVKWYSEKASGISDALGDIRHRNIWMGNLAMSYCIERDYQRAVDLQEKALETARWLRDPRSLSYVLTGLGRAMLATGKIEQAQSRFTEALDHNVPEVRHIAALGLAITLLRMQLAKEAEAAFQNTIDFCESMLKVEPRLFEQRYTLATALVGCAVCQAGWEGRATELEAACDSYQRALANCRARGVIRSTLLDLELMQQEGTANPLLCVGLLEGELRHGKSD